MYFLSNRLEENLSCYSATKHGYAPMGVIQGPDKVAPGSPTGSWHDGLTDTERKITEQMMEADPQLKMSTADIVRESNGGFLGGKQKLMCLSYAAR